MKNLTGSLMIALIAVLSACSTTNQTVNDDLYYNKNTAPATVTKPSPQRAPNESEQVDSQPSTSQDQSSDQSSNSNQATNTKPYYNDDDYYDYAYTARMRRFYSPMPGYAYYDPYYTNTYWYDYN